jgi:hypothetical protein
MASDEICTLEWQGEQIELVDFANGEDRFRHRGEVARRVSIALEQHQKRTNI